MHGARIRICYKNYIKHITVTKHCLQLHLGTYKHNYMFRDSAHLNHKF